MVREWKQRIRRVLERWAYMGAFGVEGAIRVPGGMTKPARRRRRIEGRLEIRGRGGSPRAVIDRFPPVSNPGGAIF
jgi:hypothetical protein